MNTKIISLALIAVIYFFASCNNNSTTTETHSDSATHEHTDTTAHDHDANAGNSPGLMSAMNSMMEKMRSMKMSGDFDIDLANMMIEHHQGAINIAQMELTQGKDQTMKAKAQEIITKQTEGQKKLRDFIKSYKPSEMKHGEGELQKSMSGMNEKMKSMQMTGDVDNDFAMMMTTHHEEGIAMAKMQANHGMSEQLKQMMKKDISEQEKDIKVFRSWLSASK